jgi:hypothetical protein
MHTIWHKHPGLPPVVRWEGSDCLSSLFTSGTFLRETDFNIHRSYFKPDVNKTKCFIKNFIGSWKDTFYPRQRKNNFSSSLNVQTGSGAHTASCPMDTGGPSPGTKARPRSDADHLHHLVPRSGMYRSYTSSPPEPLQVCCGTALASGRTLMRAMK